MSIDATINNLFSALAETSEAVVFHAVDFSVNGTSFSVPLILIWLVAASLFFTFYFGFINFRYFKHSVDVALNKYNEPDADGQLSSFQALMTSLSGTVGLGNIAGVAVAITVGGPGAVLWMMLMGFFSMSTKFIEATLGVKYRLHHDKAHPGEISGGPMYYLRAIFDNRNIPYAGSFLAGMFAVGCIAGAIGGGNMFQANQTFMQFVTVTGGPEHSWLADKGWLYGLVLAGLVGIVIIGGLRSIANVASRLVPGMALLYMAVSFIAIAANAEHIPGAIATIFREALVPEAGLGGLIGAILAGVRRATFSNEAGLGSSAIVHCTAKTNIPARQGIAGMMGSFVDTVIVCMVTALLIVISGVYEGNPGVEGVGLVSKAMGDVVSWFPYILAVVVFLFAYSTLITWYYYAEKSLTFLFGEKDWLKLSFKLLFCAFVVIGCSSELSNVIRFSDALMFTMAIPNIVGLYVAAPEVKRDLQAYIARFKEEKAVLKTKEALT